MNLLDVHNLNIDFAATGRVLPMVSNVSFGIGRGEILALVGESGCGKSISCLALTGLLPSPPARVRADRIHFETPSGTVDLATLPPRRMRRIRGGKIAYIFQEPSVSLNPVFRVGDQIAEVIELHRPEVSDLEGEVISLLKSVGIPAPESRINAYPHELSGGMQQRIMIAMALAGNPELLIADEPTTALDVTIQAQILELVDRIRRERSMAVILVTHNLGIVAQLADHDDSIHVPHGREPDDLPGALGLFHHHKLPASLYFRGERIQRGCDKAVAQRMSRVLRMIVDEHADDPGTVLGQQNARHAGNILPLFEQRRHALNRLV